MALGLSASSAMTAVMTTLEPITSTLDLFMKPNHSSRKKKKETLMKKEKDIQ